MPLPAAPQFAVAVMDSFRVPAGADPADTARTFAESLHNTWGVGSADCDDNGVLLLLELRHRQMYVSTGRAAVKQLPPQVLQRMMDGAKADMRAGQYGEAVLGMLAKMGLTLAGEVWVIVCWGWGIVCVGDCVWVGG
jgi:uncharacterized membrane protein YgcG